MGRHRRYPRSKDCILFLLHGQRERAGCRSSSIACAALGAEQGERCRIVRVPFQVDAIGARTGSDWALRLHTELSISLGLRNVRGHALSFCALPRAPAVLFCSVASRCRRWMKPSEDLRVRPKSCPSWSWGISLPALSAGATTSAPKRARSSTSWPGRKRACPGCARPCSTGTSRSPTGRGGAADLGPRPQVSARTRGCRRRASKR